MHSIPVAKSSFFIRLILATCYILHLSCTFLVHHLPEDEVGVGVGAGLEVVDAE